MIGPIMLMGIVTKNSILLVVPAVFTYIDDLAHLLQRGCGAAVAINLIVACAGTTEAGGLKRLYSSLTLAPACQTDGAECRLFIW